MKVKANGINSKTFINALAKVKRELKKVDYDESQVIDIVCIITKEYLLTNNEKEMLIKKANSYIKKMNDVYSLPFDAFEKWVNTRKH